MICEGEKYLDPTGGEEMIYLAVIETNSGMTPSLAGKATRFSWR